MEQLSADHVPHLQGGAISALLEAQLQRFGHSRFRVGQRETIETLLERKRMLLVAPTGGGKSLTYQLPATLLPSLTVVVSPLVALMHDQVTALERLGVPATYLAATLSPEELSSRMAGLSQRKFKIVYAAPERLASPGFQRRLRGLGVSLVAIDEAHCISEWGHDFRPEYAQLGAVLDELQPEHVLACTATATPTVRNEILARLGLPHDTPQIIRGFARPNLALTVRTVSRLKDKAPLVDEALAEALGSPRRADGSAIIYAPSRKAAQEESDRLGAKGWRCAAYHAGLDGEQRERVSKAFTGGYLDIVVATNAFGMGIDRGDVRVVVHISPPWSVEAYYQEVGRAGRDGELASGLMLMTRSDIAFRRRMLERSVEEDGVDSEVMEHKWSLFLDLVRWSEAGTCRHDAILRYFGDEAESLEGCGRCDICERLLQQPPRSTVEEVRKLLSGVARVHGRLGLGAAGLLLRGVDDPRLRRHELEKVRTFGILAHRSESYVLTALQRCVTAGWIDVRSDKHGVACLTDAGVAVMKGERLGQILLPEDARAALGQSRRASRDEGDDEDVPAELFEQLREFRRDQARTEAVPPFVIASDQTLRDIARAAPRSLRDLGEVRGIGPSKLERYGAGLLAVVQAWRERTAG